MKQPKQASTGSSTSGSKARPSSRSATGQRSARSTAGVSRWLQARRYRKCAMCRWWRRSEPGEKDTGSTEMKRPATFPAPAACSLFAELVLLDAAQIGGEGQLGDKGRAAPIGAEPARVQVGDVRSAEGGGVIAVEDVALRLGEVGVVVAQVERKRLVSEAHADIPGPIALVWHAIGVHS